MILSIESSCDDSSIAITEIKTKKLIYHKKISQELDHAKYGGVVPELAARLHAIALPQILEETKEYFSKLKAIAVTNQPGLSVTLVEGVTMAQALSISLNLPIIAVNHLHGHIYSLFIEKETLFPQTILLVSGGHTQVIDAKGFENFTILASTMDDSFGESFDKVSKMLGLGYPGGPVVESYASRGDKDRFNFTVPMQNSPKIASAHLIQKLKKIFKTKQIDNFSIVGGASANIYLRGEIEKLCSSNGAKLHVAELKFCSDNAAMIGRYAVDAYEREQFSKFDEIVAKPRVK